MIIGTAGHIDHGKSALVTALTGRRMDRLAEEQRRGITIDLNFAPLELPGLPPVGIVDVPGHEDFVRTMVAGASGIDLVLLVVDAMEGVRPQTLEHLAVVEQLGIAKGIPVLTKGDLADPEWLELARAELEERLARSPVDFGAVVVTSALTGEGLDQLRERIVLAAAAAGPRAEDDLTRMPVDRVFAVAGVGTVVTGTLWSGTVAVGEEVRIEPGGLRARVRSIESFGRQVQRALPGARTALGLVGVAREEVVRGHTVVGGAHAWRPVTAFDTSVRLEHDAPGALGHRHRVRLHLGTAEVMARVYPRHPIPPGGVGLARLATEQPLMVRGGDRFVLRRFSPVTTLGGGQVVDPAPPRRAAWPEGLDSTDPVRRLAALASRHPAGFHDEALPVLLGLTPAACLEAATQAQSVRAVAGRRLRPDRLEAARARMLKRLESHHTGNPSLPGLSLETFRGEAGASLDWAADHLIAELEGDGLIRIDEGVVARTGFVARAGGGEAEVLQVVEAVAAGGFEPASVPELTARLGLKDAAGAFRIAQSRGLLEVVDRDRYYARDTLERVKEAVRAIGQGGLEIAPAALRERLGVSRKFLIPLLEWCDRIGLTRRDHRGKRFLVAERKRGEASGGPKG